MGQGMCVTCGGADGALNSDWPASKGQLKHPTCKRPWVTPWAEEHSDAAIRSGVSGGPEGSTHAGGSTSVPTTVFQT